MIHYVRDMSCKWYVIHDAVRDVSYLYLKGLNPVFRKKYKLWIDISVSWKYGSYCRQLNVNNLFKNCTFSINFPYDKIYILLFIVFQILNYFDYFFTSVFTIEIFIKVRMAHVLSHSKYFKLYFCLSFLRKSIAKEMLEGRKYYN